MQPRTSTTRSDIQPLALLALASLLALHFVPISLARLIARDEGFYVLAGDLVARGRHVYLDFFFPQMPLTPYIFGSWMRLAGTGWSEARVLAGLVAAASGFIVFLYSRRRWGNVPALFALTMFMSSELVVSFFPTAKTYGLSTLWALGGAYALGAERGRGGSAFACGVLLGLATATRLMFAVLLPVAIVELWRHRSVGRERLVALAWCLAGFAVVSLPSLALLILDWDAFWFNNLEYHLSRSSLSDGAASEQKVLILSALLGWRRSFVPEGLHFPLLGACALAYVALSLRNGKRIDCAWLFALPLAAVSFMPSPAYVQYFCVVVPFLCICSAGLVAELSELASARLRSAAGLGLATLACFFIACMPGLLDRCALTGENVIGIDGDQSAGNWRVSTIEEIGRSLDRAAPEPQASPLYGVALWPGYFVGSRVLPLPGLENNFALTHTRKHPAQSAALKRFHLISRPEIERSVSDGDGAQLLIGLPHRGKRSKDLVLSLAKKHNYQLTARIGEHEIYRRPG